MKRPVRVTLAALAVALLGAAAPAFAAGLGPVPPFVPAFPPSPSSPPSPPSLPEEAPVEPLPSGAPGTPERPPPPAAPAPRTPAPVLSPSRPPASLLDPLPGFPSGPPMAPGLAVGGGGDNDSAPLNHRVTVHAAGSARLGQAPKDVPPRLGYGFGATFGRKLWAMGAPGAQVALWGNCELFHDRFSDHHGVAWDTSLGAVTVSAPGLLSQTSFVFLPVVAFDLGRVSPWVGAGLGFSLGYFHSAPSAYGPVTLTAHELVGRVAAGLDVALGRRFALGVRVGYSSALWPEEPRLRGPAFGTKELITFGPWVEAGLNFQFRF